MRVEADGSPASPLAGAPSPLDSHKGDDGLGATGSSCSDYYDTVAQDCVDLLSNARAFEDLQTALDDDLATVNAHHVHVLRQLQTLTGSIQPGVDRELSSFVTTARELDVLFARIDTLAETVAALKAHIAAITEATRQIHQPRSVKERASGMFRKVFSGGKTTQAAAAAAASHDPSTASGGGERDDALWSRVPTSITIDGLPPLRYHEERYASLLRRLMPPAPTTTTVAKKTSDLPPPHQEEPAPEVVEGEEQETCKDQRQQQLAGGEEEVHGGVGEENEKEAEEE